MKTRSLLPAVALLGLFGLFGLGCREVVTWDSVRQAIGARFPDVEQISTEELAQWLASDDRPPPVLLDVRPEAEYRVSHLPGAIRVDPDDPEPELPEHVGADTPIVTYCSVGYRSSAMAQRLRQRGFLGVRNLEGSIFAWANEGRAVTRGGEEVRQVHPFDERWGRLLDPELHAWSPE